MRCKPARNCISLETCVLSRAIGLARSLELHQRDFAQVALFIEVSGKRPAGQFVAAFLVELPLPLDVEHRLDDPFRIDQNSAAHRACSSRSSRRAACARGPARSRRSRGPCRPCGPADLCDRRRDAAPARIERTSPAASASEEKLRRITIRNMFTTFSSEGSSYAELKMEYSGSDMAQNVFNHTHELGEFNLMFIFRSVIGPIDCRMA